MPSLMRTQTFASLRNEKSELLVSFILQRFAKRLYAESLITEQTEPLPQKVFVRDDCKDVFDHYMEVEFKESVDGLSDVLEFWGQTTAYKGNALDRPEPNKTYEVRETLIEALGLRRWLREEGKLFRTLHFTLGSKKYTYPWFLPAKENTFDLSVYINTESGDILDLIEQTLMNVAVEADIYRKLEAELKSNTSLGHVISETVETLMQWVYQGMPKSQMADKQAILLSRIRKEQWIVRDRAIKESKLGGQNIKATAQGLLSGGITHDTAMVRTIKRLTEGNPFLALALDAEIDWPNWCKTHISPIEHTNLSDYVGFLWQRVPEKLILRRLLLRIHTSEGVNYVQDVDIPGLSEHNLYGGDHSQTQINAIKARILSSCNQAGITTTNELFDRISSTTGLQLLRASRRFESNNGTSLKPSFFYVEEALSGSFEILSFEQSGLVQPVGYHAKFREGNVDAYQNLKVIVSKATWKPLAIIKAKYFRRPEFPRRAKEEAYVGLTTKYQLVDGEFRLRYGSKIPLIMFIDMDKALKPLEYPITRLATAGWDVFFSIQELIKFLKSIEKDIN